MKLIGGEVPLPRVWFQDVPLEVRDALEGLSGGYEEWGEGSENIHPGDWDLVVTFNERATRSAHPGLHYLSFGASETSYLPLGETRNVFQYTEHQIYMSGETNSRAIIAPTVKTSALTELSRLAESKVANNLHPGPRKFWDHHQLLPDCVELLRVGSTPPSGPNVLLHKRTAGGGTVLLIPEEATDHGAWLVAFINYLREIHPAQFPSRPDWRKGTDWAPPALLEALEHKSALEFERLRLIDALDKQISDADQRIERELAVAEARNLRLLTAQGDELVAAVIDALRRLGFVVEDRDSTVKDGDPKLEDLRVTDPSDPGWELIAEIKGYTKGAKTNDVLQILQRPMTAYAIEKAKRPSGAWHIVNFLIDTDPSTRPIALKGDPILTQLASNDGAFIDTRDLFLASRAVETRQVRAEIIRASMRTARGRWAYTSAGSGETARPEGA